MEKLVKINVTMLDDMAPYRTIWTARRVMKIVHQLQNW